MGFLEKSSSYLYGGGGRGGGRRGVSDRELEHAKTQRWERRTPVRSHEVMVAFEGVERNGQSRGRPESM